MPNQTPIDRALRSGSDGEKPAPSLYDPPKGAPRRDADGQEGTMTSPLIPWPPRGGPDDAALPFKNLR